MELIYKGFDNLDVAYAAQTPNELAEKLKFAKEQASQTNNPVFIKHNGVALRVEPTGAKGGYAFRCDSGLMGATWFFKMPNQRDEWGIRVSCKAVLLATRGFEGARGYIEETLRTLGVDVRPGQESVGRIDFAMDFLAPGFVIHPNAFVMHARCQRHDHTTIDGIQTHGHSGRVTSVTIGKNPGRQVIVYDKREQVIAKGKVEWREIWNQQRRRAGLPDIDLSDPEASRIIRVELRLFKNHLLGGGKVRRWTDCGPKLRGLLLKALEDIRYTCSTTDSNRNRWPQHPIWDASSRAVSDMMFNYDPALEPEPILEVIRARQDTVLERQIRGCQFARAALSGESVKSLPAFVAADSTRLAREIHAEPARAAEKLAKASARYGVTPKKASGDEA